MEIRLSKEEDFYIRLRARIKNWMANKEGSTAEWSEFILLAPDMFHLMWKLSTDPDVPAPEKAKLALAITYFISPIDLIPEALLGPVGYLDDIALAAYVLDGLINKTSPEIVAKHWAGDENVLQVIQKILASADRMVGSGMWKKIQRRIK